MGLQRRKIKINGNLPEIEDEEEEDKQKKVESRFEFQQNISNALEFITNLRIIDILFFLFNVIKFVFTSRKEHEIHLHKRLTPPARKCLLAVCVLSFATRLYAIAQPKWICWDEVHFGKFATHYLNREFFSDVHPPLGKMILAMVGHLIFF